MKKTRDDQLTLGFDVSQLGEGSDASQSELSRHSATVLSLAMFKREPDVKKIDEQTQKKALLEKALNRVRRF